MSSPVAGYQGSIVYVREGDPLFWNWSVQITTFKMTIVSWHVNHLLVTCLNEIGSLSATFSRQCSVVLLYLINCFTLSWNMVPLMSWMASDGFLPSPSSTVLHINDRNRSGYPAKWHAIMASWNFCPLLIARPWKEDGNITLFVTWSALVSSLSWFLLRVQCVLQVL